jgi:hypothetical protein
MKKTFLTNNDFPKATILSKAAMKKINGGGWVCGCIDAAGVFIPGRNGPAYCLRTYNGEPWCQWQD